MPTTKNLGVVKALFIGTVAPTNTQMLWYDTSVNLHKYYDVVSTTWTTLVAGGAPVASVNGYTGVVVLDADDIDDTATTNKFYDTALFLTDLAAVDTDSLSEGAVNLYWTQARFDAAFGLKDTDDLTQGVTNLYYSDALARASVSATAPLNYVAGTGVFSIIKSGTAADGYLSLIDWNIFNNKMDVPSGTLNKIVRFTPSGNALGDSIIEDDGSRLGINTAVDSTSYIRATFTAGGAGDYQLWKSSFTTTQDQSNHILLTTASAVTQSVGIFNILSAATTRGYGILSSAFELSITDYSDASYAGVIGQASHSSMDAFGVIGNVNGSGSGDFVAGYFKASNSGGGNAYPLRIYDSGIDHTGKYLKVLDATGNISFEAAPVGDVATLAQTADVLTVWTANPGEVTNSSISDDGTSTAMGVAIDSAIRLNLFGDVATTLNARNASSTSDIKYASKFTADVATPIVGPGVIDHNIAIGAFASNAESHNVGAELRADGGNVPTYSNDAYDLIPGLLNPIYVGAIATALGDDGDNYALRLRADNDTALGKNVGLHIRVRNSVGDHYGLQLDDGTAQVGYYLQSQDLEGSAQWVAVAPGSGDVIVGTDETNNFLTKWDSASASWITSSLIQDDGSTLAMGASLDAAKYVHIMSNAPATSLYVSNTSTSGANIGVYGEAIGVTVGSNVGGHFKAINGATNYPLRIEDGNDNTGLYLKVIDANGHVTFGTTAGLGTVTDQSGGQTLHYLTKWSGANEVGDSIINEHATADSIGVNVAASATNRMYVFNDDETLVNAFYAHVNDTSATTLHRSGHFFIESSNTNINEAVRANATSSSLQNIATYSFAGSTDPSAHTVAGDIGASVGVVGYASGAATNNTGGYFAANTASSARNYGLIVEATNPGAGDWFAMKIIDGNEQSGYVLTSDVDGNATWAASPALAITGSGTGDTVTRWIGPSQIGDGVIKDDGSGKIAINTTISAGVGIGATSSEQYGFAIWTTYTGASIGYGGWFATQGTKATTTNVGVFAAAENNSLGNYGLIATVNTTTPPISVANEDIAVYANGIGAAGNDVYGIRSVTSGGSDTNIAGYFKSTGGVVDNYAIFADGGDVRFDSLPTTAVVGDVLAATNVNGTMDWLTLTPGALGAIGGTGTNGNIVRFTASSTVADSTLLDDGSTTGIGSLDAGTMVNIEAALARGMAVTTTYTGATDTIGILGSAAGAGTQEKIGVKGSAVNGTAGSEQLGILGEAGSGSLTIPASTQIGVGAYGGSNSNQDAWAFYGESLESHNGDNYGILACANNAGAGTSYIGRFKDNRTEGINKYLKSIDAMGTAEWDTLSTADIGGFGTYAEVGSYTDGYVPRWNATTNTLESGSLRDNGTNLGLNIAPSSITSLFIYPSVGSQLQCITAVNNNNVAGSKITAGFTASGNTLGVAMAIRSSAGSSTPGTVGGLGADDRIGILASGSTNIAGSIAIGCAAHINNTTTADQPSYNFYAETNTVLAACTSYVFGIDNPTSVTSPQHLGKVIQSQPSFYADTEFVMINSSGVFNFANIDDLVALAAPDTTADEVMVWDTNSNTHKKVILDDLTAGLSETVTFGGGASGEIATPTFTKGRVTAKTLVP